VRAHALLLLLLTGCAGGSPLLHPARALPQGDIRVAAGFSAHAAAGEAADALKNARNQAATQPNEVPGAPGTNEPYAEGALALAAIGPGIAPFVGGRVGVGDNYEGGIAYTGRGARIDMRKAWDSGRVSFSVGAAMRGVFYGRQTGATIPAVDLSQLRGYGADVPLLVGWESTGGLYRGWLGLRGGWDHVRIEQISSEPKSPMLGSPPTGLVANRYFGGALVGLAVGFRHVHVALELEATYQVIDGRYNATEATLSGISLTPASAIWWTF
jgi:hypothetical protein